MVVAAAEDAPTVGRISHGKDGMIVPDHGEQNLARGQVPDPDIVPAAGDHSPSIRRNGGGGDTEVFRLFQLEQKLFFSCRRIPESGGLVETAGEDAAAIRRKSHRLYPVGMPFDSERFLSTGGIPD